MVVCNESSLVHVFSHSFTHFLPWVQKKLYQFKKVAQFYLRLHVILKNINKTEHAHTHIPMKVIYAPHFCLRPVLRIDHLSGL